MNMGLAVKTSIVVGIMVILLLGISELLFYQTLHSVGRDMQTMIEEQAQQTLDTQKQKRIASLESMVQSNLNILGDVMGPMLFNGPFMYDMDEITSPLMAYMDIPEICMIQVVDMKKLPFGAAWKQAGSVATAEELPAQVSTDGLLVKQHSPKFRGKAVGYVRIFYTDSVLQEEFALLKQAAFDNASRQRNDIQAHIIQSVVSQLIGILVIAAIGVIGVFVQMHRSVKTPVERVVKLVKMVAEGDLPDSFEGLAEDTRRPDEIGRMTSDLIAMTNRIRHVLDETNALTEAIQHGQLAVRGNERNFSGAWQELVIGINHVVDAFIAPFHVTARYIDQIAAGHIPEKIVNGFKYNGDFNKVKDNLNLLVDAVAETTHIAESVAEGNLSVEVHERSADDRMMQALNDMIRTLNAMMQETDGMIHAVQDGNIAIRSNADAYHGVWRQLFEGMNTLLNTLSGAVAQSAALTQEMELARRIQTALLPNNMAYDGFDIEAVMLPAEEVGGDYYDVLTGSDGALWLAIGDVSGHGVTPGLVMMIAQTIHATIATQYPATPKQVIETVNRVLFQSVHDRLHADHFMTFTTLKYEGDGRFTHAGAHLDLIVHRQAAQACELIDTSGVFLNFIPEIAHATTNASFTLDVGDTLILYTDGLTEAWNADKVMLDVPRFVEIVRRHAGESAAAMRDAIMRDVLEWCGNRRDDDMSLVIVRRIH